MTSRLNGALCRSQDGRCFQPAVPLKSMVFSCPCLKLTSLSGSVSGLSPTALSGAESPAPPTTVITKRGGGGEGGAGGGAGGGGGAGHCGWSKPTMTRYAVPGWMGSVMLYYECEREPSVSTT